MRRIKTTVNYYIRLPRISVITITMENLKSIVSSNFAFQNHYELILEWLERWKKWYTWCSTHPKTTSKLQINCRTTITENLLEPIWTQLQIHRRSHGETSGEGGGMEIQKGLVPHPLWLLKIGRDISAKEVPPEKSGIPAPHWAHQSEFQYQEEKPP